MKTNSKTTYYDSPNDCVYKIARGQILAFGYPYGKWFSSGFNQMGMTYFKTYHRPITLGEARRRIKAIKDKSKGFWERTIGTRKSK